MCRWIAVAREGRSCGLGRLVTALEEGVTAPDQTVDAFRTAYAGWIAPILIDGRPELTRFSGVRQDDLIATFRELDQEVAETTASYVRAKLSGDVPSRDAAGAPPEYGVLARELQKKMRHKPVRQLVAEMGDALTTLTPCLMMSPLSVAQFLPAETQAFDLVVFDEASQITVPDAVGAIARGKRCIVVGDPKQMPPTNFFSRGAEDDENEEVRDLESILDEALAARAPHHRLTGHYRSRHESLITFSNHQYYGGALVTFPSADTAESAITFHKVDGIYAKGKARTNEIEAKAVVVEIVRRLRDPLLRQRTLGVVTLNSEQQRLIEDLLDRERMADPDLERFFGPTLQEPVFVKNLETVQGDQRDVVLLSVGYGPTEPGARSMSMNFGPLNRQGCERRLNVAITRATTEVVVFASFDASMIDLTRTSAEAVKDLKHYIDFAARGPVALGEAVVAVGAPDGYDSDFEMAVAERLRSFGWSIRTQVGVSKFRIDLGVVHPDMPGRFLAGIECDGATYHGSPSARDRDRVRQIVLEGLGWRLLRVWSTEFFRDPEGVAEALHERPVHRLEDDRDVAARAVEAAGDGVQDDETGADFAGAPAEDPIDEDDLEIELLPGGDQEDDGERICGAGEARPDAAREASSSWSHGPDGTPSSIEPAVPEPRVARTPASPTDGSLDPSRFYDSDYRPTIHDVAITVIDAEGPVTFKRLSDLVARAHGFQRTGKQIASVVWHAVQKNRRHTRTPDGHNVFWPDAVIPEDIVPFRGLTHAGATREWREVPHPEKLGLVREILPHAGEDASRDVADAVGVGRVTAQFRAEIAELARQLGRT